MSMKIRLHESVGTLEQIMSEVDAYNPKPGLDKPKLDDFFYAKLDRGYTHTPFDFTWGSHYVFYITYITRPGDPAGAKVYLSLIKDENTGDSHAYLEFWDKDGNELCEPVENVGLSDVFDAIKKIGKE